MKYTCEYYGEQFDKEYECWDHEIYCKADNEEYINVAELFCITQTRYEENRKFFIFKKTVPVSDEFTNRVSNIKSKERVGYFFDESEYFEFDIDSDFDYLWYDLMLSCDEPSKYIDNYTINNKDTIFEVEFKTDDSEAYISVFKMLATDLYKQNDVDLTLTKYLR